MRWPAWLGLLCCLLALVPPALAAGKSKAARQAPPQAATIQSDSFSYQIRPVPGFVEPQPVQAGAGAAPSTASNVQILLIDRQISLLGEKPHDYLHMALRPLNSQALRDVAQTIMQFSPVYQRLELHGIRVLRGSRTIDLTRSVHLDLLRRERNLEQQFYEGDVTAVGILPDIRVDDVIDIEYSVVGDNPIFKGRYASWQPLAQREPMDRMHFRLLAPANRQIRLRAPESVPLRSETRDGIARHQATLLSVRPVAEEADRPKWFDPVPRIEISEYRDWQDVSAWAAGLFAVEGDLSPELAGRVRAWKDSGLPPERLATEVLRWVQGEIRYFGVEIGVNSHLPVHPNVTSERRYGDCKDKSLLLASLLNALGISAQPTLVSIRDNRAVGGRLPAATAFDHAIVRAQVAGKTYWLDATSPPQYGSLDAIAAYDYGGALVVGSGAAGLETTGFPPGYHNRFAATDRYVVKAYRDGAELETRLVAEGMGAERVRWLQSAVPKDEFERIMRASTMRVRPSAEIVGELRLQDDRESNRVTITGHYRLPDLFAYEPGRFKAEVMAMSVYDAFKTPEVPQRTTPFELTYPQEISHSIIFELPENPIRKLPGPGMERTPHWNLRTTYSADGTSLRRDSELFVLRDHVQPRDLPAYIKDVQTLRQNAGMVLTLPVALLDEAARQDLMRALRRFDRYGESRSEALQAQIGAEGKIRQVALDLASGKLNDRQRAEAHAVRAASLSSTGKAGEGLKDIDQALQLLPQEPGYLLLRAGLLSELGRFEEALQGYRALIQAGKRNDMDDGDLKAYGATLYYLGQYEEAARSFAEAMPQASRGSALISGFWQHLAARHSQGRVDSMLGAALEREASHEWPYAVGEMLTGRLAPERLLDAARSDDPGVERDQLAEAYFYIGQKHLLDGARDQARDAFRKAVKQDVRPYLEHNRALFELNRMGEKVTLSLGE